MPINPVLLAAARKYVAKNHPTAKSSGSRSNNSGRKSTGNVTISQMSEQSLRQAIKQSGSPNASDVLRFADELTSSGYSSDAEEYLRDELRKYQSHQHSLAVAKR